MATNKNAKRSLHIQNDQTDTSGVYQRDRGADLFMAGPGGIREFTSWDDKAASLDNPDFPAAAFSDSPYKPKNLLVNPIPGRQPIPSSGGDNETPSGIEIADDVAFVAYKDYSPEVYSYIAKLKKDVTIVKRVFRQGTITNHDDDTSHRWREYGPAYIDGIGTYADCEELLNRSHCNEDVSWKFKLGDYTFASVEGRAGLGGVLSDIPDSDITPRSIDKTAIKLLNDRVSSGQAQYVTFRYGLVPDFFGDEFPLFPTDPGTQEYYFLEGLADLGIAVNKNPQADGKSFKCFYFPLDAGYDGGSLDQSNLNYISADPFMSEIVLGGEPFGNLPRGGTIAEPTGGSPAIEYTVDYWMQTFMISDDGYYYKTGHVNEAGRVDTYRRKGGSIKSIDADTEEVILQDSFGTVQNYLEDGDKIKISSVLNSDSQKEVNHPLNGIKYVKKLSEVWASSYPGGTYKYNAYHIYDDEQLTVRTNVTDYRDITSSVWTYYGSTLSSSGTWEYAETLFQQDSRAIYLNGVDMEDALRDDDRAPGAGAMGYVAKTNQLKGILKNDTVFSDVADYAELAPFSQVGLDNSLRSRVSSRWEHPPSDANVYRLPFLDPDGFKTIPERFWFGHAIAIKDKKVAISEIGNNYSYFCGIDLYGNRGGVIYLDIEGDEPSWLNKFRENMIIQPRWEEYAPESRQFATTAVETASARGPEDDPGKYVFNQSGLLDETIFVTNAASVLKGSRKALIAFGSTVAEESGDTPMGLPDLTNQPSAAGGGGGEFEGHAEYAWASLKDPLQYQYNDGRGRVCLFTIKTSAAVGFNYNSYGLENYWPVTPKSVLTFDALIDASTTNPLIYPGSDRGFQYPFWNNALKVGTGFSKLNLLIRDFRDIYWVNCAQRTDPNTRYEDDLWWDYDNNTLVHFERSFENSTFYRDQILRYERDNLIGNYSGRTSGFLYCDSFGFQLCWGEDDLLYVSNRAPHYAAPESIAADMMLMSEGLVLDEEFENSAEWDKYTTTPRATNVAYSSPYKGGAPYEVDGWVVDKGRKDLIERYTKTNRFILREQIGGTSHRGSSSSIQVVPTGRLTNIGQGSPDREALYSEGRNFSNAYNTVSGHLSSQVLKYDYMPVRDIPYDMTFRNGRLVVGVGQNPHMHNQTYRKDRMAINVHDGVMFKVFERGDAAYTTYRLPGVQDPLGLAIPFGILPRLASSLVADRPGDSVYGQLPDWLTAGSDIDGLTFGNREHYNELIPDAVTTPGPNGELNQVLIKFQPGAAAPFYSAALDGSSVGTAWYFIVTWWFAAQNTTQHVWNTSLYDTPGHAIASTRSDYEEVKTHTATQGGIIRRPPPTVNIYNEYAESYIFSDITSYPDYSKGSSGYTFRSDGDLLVTHITTDQNEFGEITSIADRLLVFEIGDAIPSFLQMITPCVEKTEIGENDIGFREGAMTFNESLNSSYTLNYPLSNRYDVINDKIVLSFPDGYAIFLDTGKSPSPLLETEEYSTTLQPYLSFAESFVQGSPYNLNDIYKYRYGAGSLYPDTIYDVNDNQKGLCYLYNISSFTREGALTRLTSLDFTVNTRDGNTEVKPLIGIHTDDPRATIVQKGALTDLLTGALSDTLQYNNNVPLYENGLQDTFGMRVVPTYTATGLDDSVGAESVGSTAVSGSDAYGLITSGTKIKDSTYNRTIRNNDGTGYIAGTYLYEFDDSSKDSFNPLINTNVESTLVVSLTSQNNIGEQRSLPTWEPENSGNTGAQQASWGLVGDIVQAFSVPSCTYAGIDYDCGAWTPWVVEWSRPFSGQARLVIELWNESDDKLVGRLSCIEIGPEDTHYIYPYEKYGIKDCDNYKIKFVVLTNDVGAWDTSALGWSNGDGIILDETIPVVCGRPFPGFMPEEYPPSDILGSYPGAPLTGIRSCGPVLEPGQTVPDYRYRQSRDSLRRNEVLHTAPYGKSGVGNPDPTVHGHNYSNNAKLSVVATYKEYDLGKIRRFSCSYFNENSDVGGGSIIRLGETRDNFSPSLYDEPSTILAGTSSKSIQVISHHESENSIPRFPTWGTLLASKYADAAIYSYRQSHFDSQYPEPLSLMIQCNPILSNNLDLSEKGHRSYEPDGRWLNTGRFYIEGVAGHSSAMPLHLGAPEEKSYMSLLMAAPLAFECASFRLHMPTPVGDPASSSMPILFGGGSGINDGFSLLVNPLTSSDGMNLAMGQPVPSSGDMTIAVSGVHGRMNTMPCIEGNLFINSVIGSGTENMPLHINRSSLATGIPLHMTAPNPVSGIFALNMNTEPFNSGLPLFERGYESSTSNTSLYIGRQLDTKTLSTYIAGPIEHNSDMSLYVSGNVLSVGTANSVDNNYEHQCLLNQTSSQFDYSSNSEMIVSTTETNSISRNKLSPSSSKRFGYYMPADIGSTLKEYFPTYASNYYNTEVARDCVASNDNYIAIAGNTSSPSASKTSLYIYDILGEDSVKFKFEYDKIRSDLVTLGILDVSNYSAKIFYKSVSISDLNKIAVSVRIDVSAGLYDVVCILQPATISKTTSSVKILDPCATDSGEELVIITEDIDGWSMTNAFISSVLSEDKTSKSRLNNIIGSSVAWHNEDLCFDKQSTLYASVVSAYSSEDYAYEHKPMQFSAATDGIGYYSNRNSLPEGTKVGFGSVIKIYGDFAFVGAPMLDPHVANQTLSAVSASSPSGAVYIYKYDSGWSHVDTVYSEGYTSQDISGVTDCGYEARLFGYNFDFNSDSGYLSVGEPMTNKTYRFRVDSSGTATFISSYTDSETGFGDTVSNCSRSIIAGTRNKIIDPVYDTDFQYGISDIESEVAQYVGEALVENVDHSIYFTKHIKMSGKNKLLVGRVFDVDYGHSSSVQIEKISLLSLGETHGNLFIKGPTGANSSLQGLNLTVRPYENKTATLGLQFASFGLSSGIPLHMEVASSSTLAMPMHMRANTEIEVPLFIKSEYTDVSSTTPIIISGPNNTTFAADLSIPSGHGLSSHSASAFVLGAVGSGAFSGSTLAIKQDDLTSASGVQYLRTEGVGAGIDEMTGLSNIYMLGGNVGPASGVTTLAIQTDASAPVSGSTTLAIKTSPASGYLTDSLDIYVSGAGTPAATILTGTMGLYTFSAAPASGVTSLVLYRRGVGGGHEVESNAPLTVANFIETSTADVYISGGHKSSNSMNLSIPSGLGVPTTSGTLFTRGYIE